MPDRRTVLTKLVSGFAAIAALGFSIPFIRSLFPATHAEHHRDIDVSSLRSGLNLKLSWLGRPVIIVARSDAQLAELNQLNSDELLDPDSNSSSQPEFAKNPNRSREPGYFLAFANCTHLGCEVLVDDKGGFDCPCHRSSFDGAGRIRRGGAAKRNLDIPDYRFTNPDTIRLINRRSRMRQ